MMIDKSIENPNAKFVVLDHPMDNNIMNISQTLSAYEVSTAQVLKTKIETPNREFDIFCASQNDWLVLCADSELHLFDITTAKCSEYNPKKPQKPRGRHTEQQQMNKEDGKEKRPIPTIDKSEGRVVDMQFIPYTNVLVLLFSTGKILFYSLTNHLFHKEEFLMSPLEDCSLCIAPAYPVGHTACILDRQKSTIHLLAIPALDEKDERNFRQQCSSVAITQTINFGKSSGLSFVVGGADSFVCFPRKKDEVVCEISLDFEEVELSELFTLQEDLQMVRVVGNFIGALNQHGKLLLYDRDTRILCHTMTLFHGAEGIKEVLDFQFLDISDRDQITPDAKMVLKVKMEKGIQFAVKQFNLHELQFNANCSEHVVLIPFSASYDNDKIVYVDAFPAESPDSIFIRLVKEAQPDVRLNKLLDLNRFADALEFAKANNLQLELVYTAVVRHCQEQMRDHPDGNYAEETFNEMMRNLELFEDNDNAGEYCIGALVFATRYEHIKRVLQFSKKLAITDTSTLEELAQFRYELASYRMIYGTDAQFGRNSEWRKFKDSETHKEYFDQLCKEGKIAEARILFTRYIAIQQHLSQNGANKELLSVFGKVISANPSKCPVISEFIESDLMPVFLFSGLHSVKQICLDLCDFLLNMSLLLEQIQQDAFPQNALKFAQTFNRVIESLKKNCETTDQHVGFLLILKELDGVDSPTAATVQLNTLISNLTKLEKIYTVYKCPLSYAEFLSEDVNSICYRILDRLRTVPSIKEHIEQFVFPYIEEHRLDRNEMLHAYIKKLANASGSGQNTNTLDILCLQITEHITDMNIRCKAIIEIASGAALPWNQQLSNVIKSILAHGQKLDPELIAKLKTQCTYAELGQIFIAYNIPLDVRSRLIGSGELIKQLLHYLFTNAEKSMQAKLQDAFKIVDLYGSLESNRPLTDVDCYFAYAYVLVRRFKDESEITSLLELFKLIKTAEEVAAVAKKLVFDCKGQLWETRNKVIVAKRQIAYACLLCVLERFMPDTTANRKMIEQTRNIRSLQNKHGIVVNFEMLREKNKCREILANYIANLTEKCTPFGIVNFGNLLSLSLLDSCTELMRVQIRAGAPKEVLTTLSFLLSDETSPSEQHLKISLEALTFIYWNFTEMVRENKCLDDNIEFCKHSVHQLGKKILPRLIDWALSLEECNFAESFLKQSSYISLFSSILEHHTTENDPVISSSDSKEAIPNKSDDEHAKRDCKIYTTNPRVGVMLPHQEGTMYDPSAVVRACAIVAASVVEPQPPMEIDEREKFDEQMCESWQTLFTLLSSSHILLEIQARQFANRLPCFNKNTKVTTAAVMGMDRHVTELCKKILSVPVADLYLAAHLLGGLSVKDMKTSLHELRRWVTTKKNVRYTLNLIRVSLFLLLQTSPEDERMIKQVATWYESIQWQKRLMKHGVNLGNVQLKPENVYDLAPEFAKVLLPAGLLKEYCEDVGANGNSVLLNYGIELCKLSSCLPPDSPNFNICIETAKAALENLEGDERAILILNQTIQEVCPYNYEAIGILLQKLEALITSGVLNNQNSQFQKINDMFMLIKFLSSYQRNGSISQLEIRWYKQFVNPKHYDISMLTKSGMAETFDETAGFGDVSLMPAGPQKQGVPAGGDALLQNESNLPIRSLKRLPFHIFLVDGKEAYEKFQTPFVLNEITIYNVEHWITLVEFTKVILQQSRTSLLVSAINTHVHEVVKHKRELTEDELKLMKKLIFDSHNRLSILKGLAVRFQRIPLSQTKISLIQLCCDVVEEWVNNAEKLQIPAIEHPSYAQNRTTMLHVLAELNIEYLLQTNGLLDADTATLTKKPEELINHLLCNGKIDWHDQDCVAKHFRIIDEIARIHSVELEDIFNDLIDHWIIGSTEQLGTAKIAASSDPDSTLDFMSSGSSTQMAIGATGDDLTDFAVPVLYDDPNTTRIVLLLNKIKNPLEKIVEFSQKSGQSVSMLAGGYLTKIRIASCILRFLSDDQMQQLFGMNQNQFCTNLVTLLNQRLYSICRIEISPNELQDADRKVDFVRTILSPQSIYRQTPEIANLLVCLVVDNGIDDLALLGKTADRLLQLRLSRQLRELLKYIRGITNKDIRSIPNLAMYYGRAFEALFGKLDSAKEHNELRGLVYFLIGCPVEGQSYFLRAESILNAANAKSSAALVAIAGNAVADVSFPLKELEDGDADYSDVKLDQGN